MTPERRPSPLPAALIRRIAPLVPADRRADWTDEWLGEIEYYQRRRSAALPALLGKCAGALADALWLRRRHGGHRMIGQDLRYALRGVARQKQFSAVVVLTLALCIGATSAIFSVVHAVLLRPLPYARAERLVSLWSNDTHGARTSPEGGHERTVVAGPDFEDWRARAGSLERLGAYFAEMDATLGAPGDPERLKASAVSADLFPTLGVAPAHGRGILPAEERGGRVVVLGHGIWMRRFGGSGDAIGTSLTLDGVPYTIVGVMPRGFALPESRAELFTSLVLVDRWIDNRGVRMLNVVGRLAPGATLEGARAEMGAIARGLAAAYPATNAGFAITALPLRDQIVGDVERGLWVLLGAVALVLLIGCANVANLLVARGVARRRELAVRVALGAGRGRLVQQMLAESLVLALAAGALGLAIAFGGVRLLLALSPESLPRAGEIAVSAPVLLFTLAVSLATAVVFGLAPALHAARIGGGARRRGVRGSLSDALRDGGRGGASRAKRALQRSLVVGEVALAVVLVVGAGLLINSFVRLRALDPGFRAEGLVAFKLAPPSASYTNATKIALYERLLAHARALPGVVAVGGINRLPLNDNNASTYVMAEGQETVEPRRRPEADLRTVTAGYFATMGIPLRAGRDFTALDRRDSLATPVVVMNHTLARRVFGAADPVGRRVKLGQVTPQSPWWTVVGVVGDVRDGRLRSAPRPQLFMHALQSPPGALNLVIRTADARTDPTALVAAMRREVARADPALPVYDVTTLPAVLARASAQERFTTTLLALWAGLALLLAAVGVYALMAHSVAERTPELGIRIALGARPADVFRLVAGEGLRLTIGALAIGLAAALALGRVMASLLFGVSARDLTTFAGAAAVLLLAALLACFIPARRAVRVDPLVAIRES